MDMTYEGLGEMFEVHSADMCAGKFLLKLMGGRMEGLACADPVVVRARCMHLVNNMDCQKLTWGSKLLHRLS